MILDSNSRVLGCINRELGDLGSQPGGEIPLSGVVTILGLPGHRIGVLYTTAICGRSNAWADTPKRDATCTIRLMRGIKSSILEDGENDAGEPREFQKTPIIQNFQNCVRQKNSLFHSTKLLNPPHDSFSATEPRHAENENKPEKAPPEKSHTKNVNHRWQIRKKRNRYNVRKGFERRKKEIKKERRQREYN